MEEQRTKYQDEFAKTTDRMTDRQSDRVTDRMREEKARQMVKADNVYAAT